jgi:hypothetical protein
MQGAGVGLSGVDRQLAGTAQGMQGAQVGLAGVGQQLAAGQLGECIDLFMRLSKLGQEFQAAQQSGIRPPPPAAADLK